MLGLQPLGHRTGAAGIRRTHVFHAVPAVLDRRTKRCAMSKPSAIASSRRVHGDDGAHAAGARQRLYESYRAIEERGLVLSFHSAFNWSENVFRGCNRFIAVHALGFSFYNILHCTNWVVNGLPNASQNCR